MLTLIGPEYRDGNRVLACQVSSEKRTEPLWFRVPVRWRGLLGLSVDPFVTAMLPVAMRRGEQIVVRAPMSERLFNALTGPVQDAMLTVRPELSRVEIEPYDIRSEPIRNGEGLRATGFSGGVDSWWVVGQHLTGSNRLDLLTFHDVGSHGGGERGAVRFERRLARATGSAELIGLPLVVVESNLRDFIYRANLRFDIVHAFANLSAAQALQGGVAEFLYAASVPQRERLRPYHDATLADAVVVPGLATESLETIVAGGHLTRVQRTAEVAGIPESYNRLDVCFDSPAHVTNCGKCPKCLRTALTLELLGEVDKYVGAFDMEAYRRAVPAFVRGLLRHVETHPVSEQELFGLEIVTYANENGIDLVNTYLGPQEAE